MTTKTIALRHQKTVMEQDIEGVMADFADNATSFINGQTFIEGKDNIRAMYEHAFSQPSPGRIEHIGEVFHGDVAHITWTIPGAIKYGSDAFVIIDDKIAYHMVTMYVEGQ